MAERRSGRAKKAIDYSKLSEPAEDDDDFEEFQSAPKKKVKAEPKENIKSKEKPKTEISSQNGCEKSLPKPESPSKSRLPLEDKVLQRQIKQALEVSKTDIDNADDKDEGSEYSGSESSNENSSEDQDSSSEVLEKEDLSSDDEAVELKKTKKRVPKKGIPNSTPVATSKKKEKEVAKQSVKKGESVKTELQSCKKPILKLVPCDAGSSVINNTKKGPAEKCSKPLVINTDPVSLPAKGIRLGLSRKIPRKPLHVGVKPQL